MSDSYEQYEKECEVIRKENEGYLDLFREDLKAKGLTDKTISRHVSNLDFYLNEYMLYEDAQHMEAGTRCISDFLGYFFIRKCMWSSPSSIRSNAASIKKFYKSMLEHGKIEKEGYDDLCETIKEERADWEAKCAQYDNPSAPDPFEQEMRELLGDLW